MDLPIPSVKRSMNSLGYSFALDAKTVPPRESRTDLAEIAAETALKARKIIDERRIRDWINNRDVENAMLNDLDDLMFSVKGRYDLPLTGTDIDELLESIIRVTKRRETQS